MRASKREIVLAEMAKEDLDRKHAKQLRKQGGGTARLVRTSPQDLVAQARPIASLNRQIAAAEARLAKRERDIRQMKRALSLVTDAELRVRMDDHRSEIAQMLKEAGSDDHATLVDDFENEAMEFEAADAQEAESEQDVLEHLRDPLANATDEELRVVKDLQRREEMMIEELQGLEEQTHARAVAMALDAMPHAPTGMIYTHNHKEGDGPCECQGVSASGHNPH